MGVSLAQLFPPPRFLTMPSVGIDISDTSVKFVELIPNKKGVTVGRFGAQAIPEGVMSSGKIKDANGLTQVLAELKREHDLTFVRASLPEEQGYLFETTVPTDAEDIRTAIDVVLEENVPIAPTEAVVGYDRASGKDVVVSVFPHTAAENYTKIFHDAGLTPLSLEIEPQAIARAVLPEDHDGAACVIDMGRARSGVAMAYDGLVRFATTIDIGGDDVDEQLRAVAPEGTDDIEVFKNEVGVRALRDAGPEALGSITGLVAELERYINYWNTHDLTAQQKRAPITSIILCGGNANMAGLAEHIGRELKLSCSRADVWTNVLSLKNKVPPIFFHESLGFATAIGLALRSAARNDSLLFD